MADHAHRRENTVVELNISCLSRLLLKAPLWATSSRRAEHALRACQTRAGAAPARPCSTSTMGAAAGMLLLCWQSRNQSRPTVPPSLPLSSCRLKRARTVCLRRTVQSHSNLSRLGLGKTSK